MVLCRFRKLFVSEEAMEITYASDQSIRLSSLDSKRSERVEEFSFDRIFDTNQDTNEVYQNIRKHVWEVRQGNNLLVMTYGATNSGKSFTVFGSCDQS